MKLIIKRKERIKMSDETEQIVDNNNESVYFKKLGGRKFVTLMIATFFYAIAFTLSFIFDKPSY